MNIYTFLYIYIYVFHYFFLFVDLIYEICITVAPQPRIAAPSTQRVPYVAGAFQNEVNRRMDLNRRIELNRRNDLDLRIDLNRLTEHD